MVVTHAFCQRTGWLIVSSIHHVITFYFTLYLVHKIYYILWVSFFLRNSRKYAIKWIQELKTKVENKGSHVENNYSFAFQRNVTSLSEKYVFLQKCWQKNPGPGLTSSLSLP